METKTVEKPKQKKKEIKIGDEFVLKGHRIRVIRITHNVIVLRRIGELGK